MAKAKATAAPKKNTATSTKKRIILTLNAEHGAEVYVAGTFNNWEPEKQMIDKTGTGTYSCQLMLTPGTYEYKFKVNNAWVLDQNNPNFTQNNLGTLNSVLNVQ